MTSNNAVDFMTDAGVSSLVESNPISHAGEPHRWLVIYDLNNSDSLAWAEAYRLRRGIPSVNLCGLDLPGSETLTPAQYETTRQQISDYLSNNGLVGEVVGLLLGFGVPGYADIASLGVPTPVSSYLHTDDTHGSTIVNPLHQDPIDSRPSVEDLGAIRLTGRIDAPDLASALAWLDRADALAAQALAHDQDADLLIDINPDNPNIGPSLSGLVADWVVGMDFKRLRLPATIYDASALDASENEAVVWGWRHAAPPSGFFDGPAGRRLLCLQFAPEPQPATTARDADGTDWLSSAAREGFAAVAVASRPYSISEMPLPHLFFEALRLGWTLAEAWLVAQPFLRGGLQLLGDPLMRIDFPKAGFDVFGPVDRLEQIDFDQPVAILHAGETQAQLAPSDAPTPGGSSRYLVRRYDAEGRPDLAASTVHAALEQSAVVTPALPAWPAGGGWRVGRRDSAIRMTAVWPRSIRGMGVDRVELYGQTSGNDPILIDAMSPVAGQRQATFLSQSPTVTTRFRFRVVQGPAVINTPWSAWVQAPAPANSQLTLLENQT